MVRTASQVQLSLIRKDYAKGGANQAKTHGNNRKSDKRYEARTQDFQRMMENATHAEAGPRQRMETGGFHKPGSHKKVY